MQAININISKVVVGRKCHTGYEQGFKEKGGYDI
jgi:hypothetical protein